MNVKELVPYSILLIFINFNFYFLAFYMMYFENYFANTSTKFEEFNKPFTTFAFVLYLYRYTCNTRHRLKFA